MVVSNSDAVSGYALCLRRWQHPPGTRHRNFESKGVRHPVAVDQSTVALPDLPPFAHKFLDHLNGYPCDHSKHVYKISKSLYVDNLSSEQACVQGQ